MPVGGMGSVHAFADTTATELCCVLHGPGPLLQDMQQLILGRALFAMSGCRGTADAQACSPDDVVERAASALRVLCRYFNEVWRCRARCLMQNRVGVPCICGHGRP